MRIRKRPRKAFVYVNDVLDGVYDVDPDLDPHDFVMMLFPNVTWVESKNLGLLIIKAIDDKENVITVLM